jgi:hypothetical protein
MFPLLPALLLASAPSVSVQLLEDGWFRLTIIYRPTSIEAHANAQLRLIAAADRLCKGKGRRVSEGTLTVNEVTDTALAGRKRGRRLSLSEEWRCGPAGSPRPLTAPLFGDRYQPALSRMKARSGGVDCRSECGYRNYDRSPRRESSLD